VVAALVKQVVIGAWWVDAAASLGIVWFLVREGREAWGGEQRDHCRDLKHVRAHVTLQNLRAPWRAGGDEGLLLHIRRFAAVHNIGVMAPPSMTRSRPRGAD
jgi:hypothetical protein